MVRPRLVFRSAGVSEHTPWQGRPCRKAPAEPGHATLEMLEDQKRRAEAAAKACGVTLGEGAFIFSASADSRVGWSPPGSPMPLLAWPSGPEFRRCDSMTCATWPLLACSPSVPIREVSPPGLGAVQLGRVIYAARSRRRRPGGGRYAWPALAAREDTTASPLGRRPFLCRT